MLATVTIAFDLTIDAAPATLEAPQLVPPKVLGSGTYQA